MECHYIREPLDDAYFQNKLTKKDIADKKLLDICQNKKPADNLHIIAFNNINKNDNREGLKKFISDIIERNSMNHIVLYSFGINIKEIFPIIPCDPELLDTINDIFYLSYDNDLRIDVSLNKKFDFKKRLPKKL